MVLLLQFVLPWRIGLTVNPDIAQCRNGGEGDGYEEYEGGDGNGGANGDGDNGDDGGDDEGAVVTYEEVDDGENNPYDDFLIDHVSQSKKSAVIYVVHTHTSS